MLGASAAPLPRSEATGGTGRVRSASALPSMLMLPP